MTFTEWLIRQPDSMTVTLEAAWNAGFAAGQDSIESRLNQNTVSSEAPSQEPVDWKAEYLQCVDGHNLTLDELRDAAAQIESLKRELEVQRGAHLMAQQELIEQCEQIAQLQAERDGYIELAEQHRTDKEVLQAENAELRQALVHYDFCTDVPQQAVNAIDAVLSGAPVKDE